MTSTISDRTTRSSRNESGMRPAMDRLRSAAELGFDLGAHGGHVGTALSLALDDAHDLAHVFDAGGARGGNGIRDQRIDLRIAQLRRQIALKQGYLGGFLGYEVGTVSRLKLHQGLFALLYHLLEDGEHLATANAPPFIPPALLAPTPHPPNPPH